MVYELRFSDLGFTLLWRTCISNIIYGRRFFCCFRVLYSYQGVYLLWRLPISWVIALQLRLNVYKTMKVELLYMLQPSLYLYLFLSLNPICTLVSITNLGKEHFRTALNNYLVHYCLTHIIIVLLIIYD